MAKKQGGPGARKYGRNKTKCERYRLLHVREKNKIKRVLQSSGIQQAGIYAAKVSMTGYFASITKKEK